jgi:hypothetical protein
MATRSIRLLLPLVLTGTGLCLLSLTACSSSSPATPSGNGADFPSTPQGSGFTRAGKIAKLLISKL